MSTPSPGWKSSEFIVVILSNLVAVLISSGYLKPEDQEPVMRFLDLIISGGITLGTSMVYIVSRMVVKKTHALTFHNMVQGDLPIPKKLSPEAKDKLLKALEQLL